MKKKRISEFLQRLSVGRKILCSMRLTVILTIFLSMNAFGNAVSQTVSLKLENATLREAFKMLKQQTGVYFIFNEEEIAADVRLNMKVDNLSLENTVKQILQGLPYAFECLEGMVIIKPHKEQLQQDEVKIKILRGKVTDEKGEPLPGVSVVMEGMVRGCATDVNGEYSLVIENRKGIKIVYSFVGMCTQTRVWEGQENINVVMKMAVTDMDEVVVTGYQTLNRRESASAISTIKAEDIFVAGAPSIDQMLQGKIPGMMVMNTSGEPSATPKIRIRGNATINGNKAPVWVVDGVILEQAVPFTASDLNSEDAEYLIGNAIAGLNPQDIETITVLKDASATAIYGVKAANGVIVITTKKGKSGKPVVSYSGDVTINQRPSYRNFDRMNSQERMQLSREIVEAGLKYPRIPSGDSYEGLLERLYNKEITQKEFSALTQKLATRNTDWFKELFRNSVTHSHNLSISGGGENMNYYFSTGYNKNEGSARGSASERFTSLAKVAGSFNRFIDFQAKIDFSTTKNDGFHATVNPFQYAYQRSRTLPAYGEDGSWFLYNRGDGLYYNILKEMNYTGQEGKVNDFNALLNLTVKLWRGFSYQGTFSYHNSSSNQRNWGEEQSYYISKIRGYEYHAYDETTDTYKKSVLPYGGILDQVSTHKTGYTVRNSLNYIRILNHVHDLNAMVGVEIRGNKYKGVGVSGYGWSPKFGEKFMPIYTDAFVDSYVRTGRLNPTNTNTVSQVASFFGTASYSYDNRYVLNANIRSDGANKFGSNPKYRWLPTWSVAAKWILSNENFMSNVGWIDHLSFRGSYGIQGNIHDDSSPNLIVQFGGRDGVSGLDKSKIYRLPNPDLRWEKTRAWNAAVDFTLLKGRLKGGFDVYKKYTSDLIMSKAVATSNGRGILYMNAGKMENSGFEGFLNVGLLKKRLFEWNFGLNFGRNINQVTLANGNDFTGQDEIDMLLQGNLAVEGEPVGSMYSYRFYGLSGENGYPLFYGKDGKLYHEGEPQMMELVNSGSIFPKLSGGFDTQLTFKRSLSLSFAFTYNIGGVKRLPDVYEDKNNVFDPLTNVSTQLKNRWKKQGDEAYTKIPVLYDRDVERTFVNEGLCAHRPGIMNYIYPTELYNLSDERVVKCNYLRLKMIALSYMVPEKLLSKLRISTLMLRFQATNLAVWADKKWEGLDPETPQATIPVLPTYSLSVNISF